MTAYTTDIFPCFPEGGRPPRPHELDDALTRRFLLREIELLRPKVVLLLGDKSYGAFFRHLLNRFLPEKLTDFFRELSPDTQLPHYSGAVVIPFLHPSGANPNFSGWVKEAGRLLCDQPQVRVIAQALVQ